MTLVLFETSFVPVPPEWQYKRAAKIEHVHLRSRLSIPNLERRTRIVTFVLDRLPIVTVVVSNLCSYLLEEYVLEELIILLLVDAFFVCTNLGFNTVSTAV